MRLFAVLTDETAIDYRLRMMILIAATTGWREGQIINLKKEDLDYTSQTVRVSESKHEESKRVKVSDETWSFLSELAAHVSDGRLWRNTQTGEELKNFPRNSWNSILKKAKIENLHFHDIRATVGSELILFGESSSSVQKTLGHRRLSTTEKYIRLADAHLQSGLDKLGKSYEQMIRIRPKSDQAQKQEDGRVTQNE